MTIGQLLFRTYSSATLLRSVGRSSHGTIINTSAVLGHGMTEFVTVATMDELDDGEGTVVEANGHTIALFRAGGDFYAIGNDCTHMGGPLGEGDLDGSTVTCPWHGAQFDITSGEVLKPPADESEPNYEVRIDGSEVQVAV